MKRIIYVPCSTVACEGHKIELPDEIMEECAIIKEDKCSRCGDKIRVKLSMEIIS